LPTAQAALAAAFESGATVLAHLPRP
jgi:hypothetical protein